MGAQEFFSTATGKDAGDAFKRCVEEAQYEHGHGGYGGTIAEKSEFRLAADKPLPKKEALALAEIHISDHMSPFNDKWGPAGCIEIEGPKPRGDEPRRFLFFGWALS